MNSLEEVKARIAAMLPEDKNGLILYLVQVFYGDPETGEIDTAKEWTGDTVEIAADALKEFHVIQR